MAVPDSPTKNIEAHSEEPSKVYYILCYNFDKKGNNKLENFCTEIGNYIMKNMNIELDGWFTYLIHLNDWIEKIGGDFKNIKKKLSMHMMNNMCGE